MEAAGFVLITEVFGTKPGLFVIFYQKSASIFPEYRV